MRRIFFILLLVSFVAAPVYSQAPDIGRIALYADSLRTTSEVTVPGPFTIFDVYIFCQPSVNGMYCAEFMLQSTTGSMIVTSTEWHPGTSVTLGDLATGVSACLLECQSDWVLLARASMMNSQIDPAILEVVRHPDVGYYQFANCLEGSPIEPVFIGPQLCFNQSCSPDTDPPDPVSVEVEDDIRITLIFNEKLFESDAIDHANYRIYRTDQSGDSIPINFALLEDEGDAVWMVLGLPLADAPYTLEVSGIRDVAGNPSLHGASIGFRGIDTHYLGLESVHAPDAETVIFTFNEPITEASAENLSNYTFICVGAACAGDPQPASAVLQADQITVSLILQSPMVQNVVYEVEVRGLVDLAGNVQVGRNWAQFAPPDISPPYISQVSFIADTALTIHWSEAVDEGSAEDLVNFTLQDDGPPPGQMTLTSASLSSGRYLRLGFQPALDPHSTYTLFLSGVMDMSLNVMLPDTVHLVPLDDIPPLLITADCVDLNLVEISFDGPIDPSVTETLSNFRVYPVGHPTYLIGVTDVSCILDCTRIRIHLEEYLGPGREYTVQVLNMRDLAGNVTPDQHLDFFCYDVYPPTVDEIYLVDLLSLHVRFSEVVNDAAQEVSNFTLHPAADSTAVIGIESAALVDGSTKTILETAESLVHGEIYTLRMSGIEDDSGNPLGADSIQTFEALDIFSPSLVGLSVTSDSLVHLEFNEILDPLSAENAAHYTVARANDPSDSLMLRSATLDSAGTLVDLLLDEKGGITTLYTEFLYRVHIRGVSDFAGNSIDVISGSFEFIDDIPPRLLSAEGATTRNVIVYFDQALDYHSPRQETNFKLYPTGNPVSPLDIFISERRTDGRSVNLILGEDMIQHTDYTVVAANIEDMLGGNTMEPDSTEFHFLDDRAPVLLNVDLVHSMRLSIVFNESVDSATAVDPDNYTIHVSANESERIGVTSIGWMSDEVRLNLAAEPMPNILYTVIVDGVEDRFGNACSGLAGEFSYYVHVPSAKIHLYADEAMSTQEVETDHAYQQFSFYVFCEPGDNGVFGAEFALQPPETYFMIGTESNSSYVAMTLGDPYSGFSASLSQCMQTWFWMVRVDCMCLIPDVQEIVWVLPHPDTGAIRVATCLYSHPLEAVVETWPLLINTSWLGTLLDNWAVSAGDGSIELTWSIIDTDSRPSFEVSRTRAGSEVWQSLPAGLVTGDGLRFRMIDTSLEPGQLYRYRIECIDEGGKKVLFETDAVRAPVAPLALRQNSPNPFNPSTSIGFYLPKSVRVRLEIYDVNGRLVDVLADGNMPAGEHSVEWNGRDRMGANISSGVYFYRLIAGKESLSRKMVLLR